MTSDRPLRTAVYALNGLVLIPGVIYNVAIHFVLGGGALVKKMSNSHR